MKKFTSLLLAFVMIFAIAAGTLSASAATLLEGATFADFSSFKPLDETKTDSSYTDRTNAAGWKVTGARSDAAEFTGSAPMITLNGKTSAPGTLTTTAIVGGIGKLAFNYGFAFSDTQFSLTINVKKADGTVVKTEKLEKTGLAKETVYEYVLDVNTNEDVIVELINNCMTNTAENTDKNKDRLGIWNLCWTAPAAADTTAAPEATEAPADTTAAPEATEAPAETTAAPEATEAPAETTAAPETTEPGSSTPTGDNGVFFAVAAIAVIAVASVAVASKKREN